MCGGTLWAYCVMNHRCTVARALLQTAFSLTYNCYTLADYSRLYDYDQEGLTTPCLSLEEERSSRHLVRRIRSFWITVNSGGEIHYIKILCFFLGTAQLHCCATRTLHTFAPKCQTIISHYFLIKCCSYTKFDESHTCLHSSG